MKHIVKYYIDNPVDCVNLKVKMKLSGLKYDIDWIPGSDIVQITLEITLGTIDDKILTKFILQDFKEYRKKSQR